MERTPERVLSTRRGLASGRVDEPLSSVSISDFASAGSGTGARADEGRGPFSSPPPLPFLPLRSTLLPVAPY